MAPLIKIGIDPKKRFGVSAKPGEITFGTHTHLNHYIPPQGLELRLLIAQRKMRTANAKMLQVPKNRSIKTMLAELNQVRSVLALASAQRMALLSNYQELKMLKEKATTSARKKYQKRAEREYTKVRSKEKLINDAREYEKRLKEHLTKALSNKVELKTKKSQKEVNAKTLGEEEKENVDMLLDTRLLYTKRRTTLLAEIKTGKLSTNELVRKRMQLTDTELSLEHTNQLLKDLTKPPQKSKAKKN